MIVQNCHTFIEGKYRDFKKVNFEPLLHLPPLETMPTVGQLEFHLLLWNQIFRKKDRKKVLHSAAVGGFVAGDVGPL